MSIAVGNSGSPGIAAVSAAAAGENEERRRRELLAAQARTNELGDIRNRQFAADQQFQELQFRANENALNRDFQLDQQLLARDRDNNQFRQEVALTGLQSRLAEQREERRYTLPQRARAAQILEAMENLEASEAFTDEEKADARRQLEEQLLSIKPMPRLPEESPYPPGQSIGDTWVDPQSGELLSRQSDGTTKSRTNPLLPTHRDTESRMEQAFKSLTFTDPETGRETPPTAEQLDLYMQRVDWFHRRSVAAALGQPFNEPMPGREVEAQQPNITAQGDDETVTVNAPFAEKAAQDIEYLKSSDGAAKWGAAHPEQAAKLISAENPSRKLFEDAGIFRTNAQERIAIVEALRGANISPSGTVKSTIDDLF